MANNSQRRAVGAVRQDHRSRPRAGRGAGGRLARAPAAARPRDELEAACRGRHARSGVLPHGAATGARRARTKSTGASRRCCAASAATTSTSSSIRRSPFNLAKMIVGSEGTLGVVLERQGQPGAAAQGQGGAGDRVRATCSKRWPRRRSILRTRSVGRGGDGQVHPRLHASRARRSSGCGAAFIEGDPGALLCVEFYGDRAEDLPPRLDALEDDLRGVRLRLPLPPRDRRRPTRRASGACARPRSASRWP